MRPVAIDQAIAAAQAGDLPASIKAFKKAIRQQPRQASHRYNFAILYLQNDDIAEAAVQLCDALQVDPSHEEAARRLGSILAKYQLPDDCRLNPFGLRAALNFISVDHQPIITTAFAQLRQNTILGKILTKSAQEGYEAAARMLLSSRGSALLSDRLFLAALNLGMIRKPDLEFLMTQTRRLLLLHHASQEFSNTKITPFTAALARQCHNNEFVFVVSPEEQEELNRIDMDDAQTLLILAMYRPIRSLLSSLSDEKGLNAIKLSGLRELALGILPDAWREEEIATSLPSLGLSNDDVSQRVAEQYEGNPYPRWLSLPKPSQNALQNLRETVFGNAHPETLSGTHDILIAGTGTGRQAIYCSMVHGADTRITALDLSRHSLAYGARMAAKFDIRNIEFLQADILNLSQLGRKFDVIECTGVLHHMDDPFAGWRSLLELLKPNGVMLIALYSAISRKDIEAKRNADDFPGAGCDDETLRQYRAKLMAEDDPLILSEDFYSLSDFRDLVFHEHECQHTIPQIAEFLEETGLDFHGFVLPVGQQEAFQEVFPQDPLPGQLQNWWRFEQDNPQTFDAMYQLWCRKPS